MKRRLLGLALTAVLAGCSGDDTVTYRFRGDEHEIDCGDTDPFVEQWTRYDGAETVFNEWFNECGEDWVEPALDAVLDSES